MAVHCGCAQSEIYGTKPISVRKINETVRTVARPLGPSGIDRASECASATKEPCGIDPGNIQLAADQRFIGA
jgi:hypothetical protein